MALPSYFWGIYEVGFPEDANAIGSKGIQIFPMEPFLILIPCKFSSLSADNFFDYRQFTGLAQNDLFRVDRNRFKEDPG